jgi:guanylate kinase
LVADDPRLWLSRSWTTRARRPGEPEDAYHFVDRATFEERVAAGGFFEWAEFLGNLYGTPLPEPPEGSDVLLEIDLQGANQVHQRRQDARLILLKPPSDEVQAERLRGRGDDEEHVAKRLLAGAEEIRVGRRIAHHEVVNDDLVRATREVAGIVDSYRSTARRGGGAAGGGDAPSDIPPDDAVKGL